jgi:hypothetical protein
MQRAPYVNHGLVLAEHAASGRKQTRILQRLRLAIFKGPNRVGASSLTRGRKQILITIVIQ